MILSIVLNVNDFLAKERRKDAYFSTVFFIAGEFVHCIKSHLRVILLFSKQVISAVKRYKNYQPGNVFIMFKVPVQLIFKRQTESVSFAAKSECY